MQAPILGKAMKSCAGLLAGLAARGARPEYGQLLEDCQRLYCEVRLGLVAGVTAQRIAAYAREPLPQRTRSGCAYLMQALLDYICQCCGYLLIHGSAGELC